MLRGPGSGHFVSGFGSRKLATGPEVFSPAAHRPPYFPTVLTHSTQKSKERNAGFPGLQNPKAVSLNREEIRPWASSPTHDVGLEVLVVSWHLYSIGARCPPPKGGA